MNTDYLFVYGTLQQGLKNEMSQFLLQNAEVIAKGCIQGKLYAISWFPGAVLSTGTENHVYGTVFKLQYTFNTFKVLDAYEGCDLSQPNTSLFTRDITTVFLENGTSVAAWVYLYNQNVDHKTQILSGDFLKDANS